MSGMKECIRCGRRIDAGARICPYCNWDQTQPVPANEMAGTEPTEVYVPPPERRWRKPVIAAVGVVIAVLIAGLAIAERLRDTGPQAAPPSEQQVEQMKLQQKEAASGPAKPQQHANVTLVPDNSAPTPAPGEGPETAAAPSTPTAPAATDTSASTATESQMAQSAAKPAKKKMDVLIDPRSLTGAAYDQGTPELPPRRRAPAPAATPASATQATHTSPVPEYQPIPDVRLSQNATARLELSIGADGRVKDVRVKDAIPSDMGRLIASVQSWRFRPATENGVPVPSSFTVELSFHASE